MKIRKFDIILVNLNPPKGHAQAGIRPCVVLQSNLFNESSSTLIITPLTTTDKKIFPSEFWIQPSKINGLSAPSRFLGSQVMTVDKEFVFKKIGELEKIYYEPFREALTIALDWENDF